MGKDLEKRFLQLDLDKQGKNPDSSQSSDLLLDPQGKQHKSENSNKLLFACENDDCPSSPSAVATMATELDPVELTPAQRGEIEQHLQFLGDVNSDSRSTREEEARMAPLFTGQVMTRVPQLYAQYGLLGRQLPESPKDGQAGSNDSMQPLSDPRVFLNIGAPWSAFICGQQGSGKSHTLSCVLENSLVHSPVGRLAKPLSGIVFHWDRYTGPSSHQICEAAYLASAGIPVRVMVSPSNFNRMKDAYGSIPALKNTSNQPVVMPLLFRDKQLNVKRMMTMMGVRMDDDAPPLYVEVILRILREMAQEMQDQHRDGLNYSEFRAKVAMEPFTGSQNGPMKLRLDLLESFLRETAGSKSTYKPPFQQANNAFGTFKPKGNAVPEIKPLKKLSPQDSIRLQDAWQFAPGTLTIVDLSCPFVDENAACALFSICLELFLEDRSSAGRIIALDEAHKFLNGTSGALSFTEDLLQVIRQQRHLGTRVVIATQEPTISPRLLELCNFTIVHRFQSPGWFKALCGHLAGASSLGGDDDEEKAGTPKKRAADLFEQIVGLQCGQALLFAPSAMTGFLLSESRDEILPVKLGMKILRIATRQRLTADGGRSIMAE